MSDEERELTPEQEAEIGRLLADARATEPMPSDVVARLDGVLAGLSEERAGSVPRGPVVDLAARRRRRVTTLLVAATAVVAVGVGVGQLVGDRDLTGSDDSAGSAEVSSEDTDGGSADAPPAARSTEASDAAPEMDQGLPIGQISESRFAAEANQLRRALPDIAADGRFVTLNVEQLPSDLVARDPGFDCAPGAWGPGVLVPVLYDGDPAVLAYRPPVGDSQVVDVLRCGTGDITHTATLPAG